MSATEPPDQSPPQGSKHAMVFIFSTVAIDSIGIGLILPVLPDLIVELTDTTLADAARWGGYLTFIYAVMQFLCGPAVGNLSDAYGRRPILLISLAALSLDYLLMAAAPTLALLFVGRLIAGVCGATFSTANAYIADITPSEQRTARFGLMGAAFGLGFVIGPVIGGLLGEISPRAPFYAAAFIAALNFIYGYLVLPETLQAANRRSFRWAEAIPWRAFQSIIRFPQLKWLLLTVFLYEIGHFVYPSVWSYFTQEAFGWSSSQVGFSLMAVGIAFVIAQGFLIRPTLRLLGPHKTAVYSLLVNFIVLSGIGLATSGWMIYALMPLAAVGAVTGPSLNGLMSPKVSQDRQGELQGVLSSIKALSVIISPLLTTQIFAAFSGEAAPMYFPGAPFLASAVLMLIALALLLRSFMSERS